MWGRDVSFSKAQTVTSSLTPPIFEHLFGLYRFELVTDSNPKLVLGGGSSCGVALMTNPVLPYFLHTLQPLCVCSVVNFYLAGIWQQKELSTDLQDFELFIEAKVACFWMC